MKNSLRLLRSVLHWFQSARRVQPEEHGSRELLRNALADMFADPETRRFLLRQLIGAGIPIEGGNPTTAAQDVCPGTFGVNCSPGDYNFNSQLGIGTATPGAKLDVQGNVRFGLNNVSATLEGNVGWNQQGNVTYKPFVDMGADLVSLSFKGSSADPEQGSVIFQAAGWSGQPNRSFVFRTKDAGIGTVADRVAINLLSGNVGIGTASPAEKLDVAGNIKSKGLNQIVFLAPLSPVGDDGAAINNAINNLLPANGGIIMLKPGPYNIQTTINITKDGVKLRGYGGNGLNANDPLTWLKAAPGVVTIVNATAPLNQSIQNIELSNLTIDGNSMNNTIGLVLSGVFHSQFRMLHVIFVSTGIKLVSDTGIGTKFSLFEHCSIIAQADIINPVTSKGLILDGANTSQNTFVDLSISYAGKTNNDIGLDMGNCDNNSFYRTWIQQRSGDLGVGVLVENPQTARANYFYHLQSSTRKNAQPPPGFKVTNASSPPNSKNLIFGYDLENGQAQPQSEPDGNVANYVGWIDSKGVAHGIGGAPFNAALAPATVSPPVLANFTWDNQGNATAVANAGGALWVSTETAGPNLRFLYKVAPATPTPWSVVIGVAVMQGSQSVTRAGLAIRDPINGRLQTLMVGYESAPTRQVIRNDNWMNYVSFSLNNVLIAFPYLPAITWLKVSDDGTNRTWYISADGQSWIQVFTSGNTSWVNDSQSQVGFVLDENDNNTFNGALWLHWAGL